MRGDKASGLPGRNIMLVGRPAPVTNFGAIANPSLSQSGANECGSPIGQSAWRQLRIHEIVDQSYGKARPKLSC